MRNGSTIANTTRMPMVVMFRLIQSTGRLSRMMGDSQNRAIRTGPARSLSEHGAQKRIVANVPTISNPTCR